MAQAEQGHSTGWEPRNGVQARPVPRLLLTKREAAASLGMSVRHFERHVQAHVRCVHSGQLTLYPVGDLERWALAESAPRVRTLATATPLVVCAQRSEHGA